MRPGALLLLILALFMGACDSVLVDPPSAEEEEEEETGEPAPCPTPLSAERGDYFPLELGDPWTFDYVYRDGSFRGQVQVDGTLRWTVTAVEPCEGGRRLYTVDEGLEGIRKWLYFGNVMSEEPVRWSRRVFFWVYADSVRVPYWKEPVPRFGAGEDTLRFTSPPGRWGSGCVGSCVSGSYAGGVLMELVRGRGMVRRSYHGHYSAGGDDYETLTRSE